ncbi:MAG: TonB-dependent receptor [Bacteroidia bacterium]|nr:TonB-dependent receptor [Bacteroidia bacterium]
MQKKLLSTLLMLFVFGSLFAQQKVIKGTVSDSKDGSRLPGVRVTLKGTKKEAATDANGQFSISYQEGESNALLFSYIGYKKEEVAINGQSNLEVKLKESNVSLNDVVVIGYGTAKKKELTGVSARIQAKEIATLPMLTATQAIQGKAAGVQIIAAGEPGGKPNVRIRGTGSILGGVDPLYVVDGILTDDITNINSSDIVSIDVLKDAAATAIYGVRASNGVIMITTKSGTKGKLSVNYDSYYGLKQLVNKVEMAGPGLFAKYSNEAAGTMAIKAEDITGSTDWMDEITRIGTIQSHSLSMNGGGEKNTYFVSLGYFKEEGILKGNDYQRISIRANNDVTISNKLKVGHTLSYAYNFGNNKPFSLFTDAYNAAPIYNAKNADGTYGSTTTSNVGNPLAKLEYTNDVSWGHRLQGTLWGEYKVWKNISFRTNFGMDGGFNYARNYAPVFLVDVNQRNDRSQLSLYRADNYRWVWDNYFNYTETFKGKHDINISVGHTAERQDGKWMRGSKKDIPAQEQYWDFSFGDPTSHVLQSGNQNIYGRRESYFARAIYTFAGKYNINATVRRDGASKFPVANRWGTFPSLGLGWFVHNEEFMSNQNLFNTLKLRASWGKIGNDNISPGQFVTQFGTGLSAAFGPNIATGAIPDQIVDPNLKWETTTQSNVGVEFSMFNGKVTGEIDAYMKETQGALYLVALPGVAGDRDNVYTTNAATISNKGLEISLGYNGTLKKDFNYTIRGNMSFNQNLVTDVGQGKALDYGSLDNGYTATRVINGQPIGAFWVYQTNGIFQSESEIDAHPHLVGTQPGDKKIVDTNGDGKIDNKDRIYVGSYQPKFFFGLNTAAYYKNFDLSMVIQGNAGNKVFNGKKTVRYGGNYNVEYDVAMERWTPTNPSTTNPRAYNGVPVPSDYFVESGTYIRLNTITLGYTLPEKLVKKWTIARFRTYLSAQNMYTWKKFSGFSPELPGAPYEAGIEKSIYPTSATYMLGVNVTF